MVEATGRLGLVVWNLLRKCGYSCIAKLRLNIRLVRLVARAHSQRCLHARILLFHCPLIKIILDGHVSSGSAGGEASVLLEWIVHLIVSLAERGILMGNIPASGC